MKQIFFVAILFIISFFVAAQTKPAAAKIGSSTAPAKAEPVKKKSSTTTVNTTPAKTKKASDGNSLNIEAGPDIAIPLKYFHMFSTFGVGLDAAVLHPFGNGLSAGGRLNYGHFLGRAADEFFTGGGSHYKASNLYNVLVEANYQFENQVIFGIDLGLGIISFNGHSDAAFAQKVRGGYVIDAGDHPLIVYLFYEQTFYHKNIGLSVNIRL